MSFTKVPGVSGALLSRMAAAATTSRSVGTTSFVVPILMDSRPESQQKGALRLDANTLHAMEVMSNVIIHKSPFTSEHWNLIHEHFPNLPPLSELHARLTQLGKMAADRKFSSPEATVSGFDANGAPVTPDSKLQSGADIMTSERVTALPAGASVLLVGPSMRMLFPAGKNAFPDKHATVLEANSQMFNALVQATEKAGMRQLPHTDAPAQGTKFVSDDHAGSLTLVNLPARKAADLIKKGNFSAAYDLNAACIYEARGDALKFIERAFDAMPHPCEMLASVKSSADRIVDSGITLHDLAHWDKAKDLDITVQQMAHLMNTPADQATDASFVRRPLEATRKETSAFAKFDKESVINQEGIGRYVVLIKPRQKPPAMGTAAAPQQTAPSETLLKLRDLDQSTKRHP